LQRGVKRVYAIDVGYGQLAWKLRQDPRVIVMERTNARYVTEMPEPIDLVTMDASFISIKLLLPNAARWLRADGLAVPLIKPQFEAGRRKVGKGGVVRDPDVHRQVLIDLLGWAETHHWGVLGLIPSPVRGPAGNIEFLAHLTLGETSTVDIEDIAQKAVTEAQAALEPANG
jgi:23S rRNA (cytidine1920-2'-O)/16S rRNA (cytidine1409-2'-O)-methyltransferase